MRRIERRARTPRVLFESHPRPERPFFSVAIDEIETLVHERGLQVQVTKLAEARDYRETLARRTSASAAAVPPPADVDAGLPACLHPLAT